MGEESAFVFYFTDDRNNSVYWETQVKIEWTSTLLDSWMTMFIDGVFAKEFNRLEAFNIIQVMDRDENMVRMCQSSIPVINGGSNGG